MDRQKNCLDLESGRPFVLEDVEADSTQSVNIGMVNLRSKKNFWGDKRVLLGQEELQGEQTALIG